MLEGRHRLAIFTAVWIIVVLLGLSFFVRGDDRVLTLAAGPASGEAFEIATAIAGALDSGSGDLRLEVFETQGAKENIQLLERGRVDLAMIQADSRTSEAVRAIASLYFDAYQLIVAEYAEIRSFSDLAGRRIAIPPVHSGQHSAFWFVADHYGLDRTDVTALPMAEAAANFAMIRRQVDAVFRVSAPGNASVKQLVGDHAMHIVPISQAAAMSLKSPPIDGGLIPRGAYRGEPPVPAINTPVPILDRLLVARAALEPDDVHLITRALFERRSDLVADTALAGFIKPVSGASALSMAVHTGAQRYYDREKPSFLQQNTRLLSGLLYVVAILSSAFIAARSRIRKSRRIRMGDYNDALMDIANEVVKGMESNRLRELQDRLVAMLDEVVRDLDKDRVTPEEFDHFSFTWQAVDTLVRDRMAEGVRVVS
jgi:TRAP transporter TAXI family solute receptor